MSHAAVTCAQGQFIPFITTILFFSHHLRQGNLTWSKKVMLQCNWSVVAFIISFFFLPPSCSTFEVDRIIACTGECSSINEISFASMHKDSHCPMQSLSLCTRVAFVKKSNWIIRCHQDLFLPATTLSRRAISSNEDRCWLRFLSQLVYNLCFKIGLFCYLNKITVNIAFHCLKPESTVGFVFS